MVRRTKIDAEDTRERILDAAEICFCNLGVTKTTLDMVAAQAGCTRGAIYWYFTEKQDLLHQVIERVNFQLLDDLKMIKNSVTPDHVIKLRRCLLWNLNETQNNLHMRNVVNLLFFCDEIPHDVRARHSLNIGDAVHFIKLLCDIFDLSINYGGVNILLKPKDLAFLVFSAFFGALKVCVLHPEEHDLQSEGVLMLDFIFTTFISFDGETLCK